MCYAASAWNTKLLEPAKAKNLPQVQLQSITSLPFELQILSLVYGGFLKRKVSFRKKLQLEQKPHFAVYLRNVKHQVIPCSLCTSRWVFKQLYDKGLVYRGVKVMPFSTACNTPLSNFESHQNYKVSCSQTFLFSSVWIWRALVLTACWYLIMSLHSKLVVKISVKWVHFDAILLYLFGSLDLGLLPCLLLTNV